MMNTIRNRNSAHPMQNCRTHPIESKFFFLLGRVERGVLIHLFPMCSHQVLNVLPSSSQWVSQHGSQVPNVFPNIFARAPHFVPYALPSVLEPILVHENWDLDVCMFGVKYFYNGESPKFQNFFLRWTNKKRQLRKRKF